MKIFLFLLMIASLTLFMIVGIGDGGGIRHPLLRDFWDIGHLVLFGLLSYSYFSCHWAVQYDVFYRLKFVSIAAPGLGAVVELLQLFLGREFSLNDIVNDLIGGYLGLLLLALRNIKIRGLERFIVHVGIILLLGLGLRNLAFHLVDEWEMRRAFPVLADFDTPRQLDRWEFSNVLIRRSEKYSKSGGWSLDAQFHGAGYPGLTLSHLIGDWSGHHLLNLTVYNPSSKTLPFELKVYDRQHLLNGFGYGDRFNAVIAIDPGWNSIAIPLHKIEHAPLQRRMNMHEIQALSLFTHNPVAPIRLYIDSIRLR